MFWGVCDLIMILGSLSANGWCCVPVLLVVWHGVSSSGAWIYGVGEAMTVRHSHGSAQTTLDHVGLDLGRW